MRLNGGSRLPTTAGTWLGGDRQVADAANPGAPVCLLCLFETNKFVARHHEVFKTYHKYVVNKGLALLLAY